MPAAAAVVAIVAGVVGAIASLIKGLAIIATIANIIAAVAGAVATIGYLIRYGFRGSLLQIASTILGIFGAISRAWKAIESRMWDLFVDYGLKEEYGKADVVLEIIWRMNKIEAIVSSIIQAIYKPVESIFISIRQTIENALSWVTVRFDEVVQGVRRYETNLITAIASAISQPYRDYLSYLDLLYNVGKAWDAFERQKWGAGVYYLLKFVNVRVSDEVRLLVELIDQKMSSLRLMFDTIFRWVRDDLETISIFIGRQVGILMDIGKLFGAEDLTEIAEKIKRFKEDTIDVAVEYVHQIRNDFRVLIANLTDPVRQLIAQYYIAQSEDARAKRLFKYISLEYFLASFAGTVRVPKLAIITFRK